MTTQYAKAPLEPLKFVRNGKYPDAFLQAELADHVNHTAIYRLRELASFASPTLAYPAADGTRVRWRFPFMMSPYASIIVCRAWVAVSETESTTVPTVRLRIESGLEVAGTPTTIGDAVIPCIVVPGGAGPGDQPNNLANVSAIVASGALPATPPANTWLFGTVSDLDNARVIAMTIYEGSLLSTAPMSGGYAVTTPIEDADREAAVLAARLIWKRGAGRLFSWSDDLSVRSRSSATAINAVDDTSTAVSGATPGLTIDLRNRITEGRTGVPCRFWVYGSDAVGAGGTVQLLDSGGSPAAEIENITTEAWYPYDLELPATLAKYDLAYFGDGTNAFTLNAAALLQYASGV